MLATIASALPIALGIVLSSIPLMVVTLTLLTRPSKRAVLAFLLGWVGGMALLGSLVLVLAQGWADTARTPAPWLAWVRVVLGLLLLGLAVRQWQNRPRAGAAASPPAWMSRLEQFTPRQAAALGGALTTLNPKNALLLVSGCSTILAAAPGPTAQWVALVVFIAVASLGVAAPALLYLVRGERAMAALQRLQAGIVRHNASIMATVLALLGLVVLANGLAQR